MIKPAIRIALAMVALAIVNARAAEVLEPDGYRLEDYRAPTPATLRGAAAIGTQEAEKIWRSRIASFVDVLPRPPRPRNLPEGTLWRDKPRADIPDSIWLPDTGYGELPTIMETYFETNLQTATLGDHNKHLVFYCLANCWMSWNATKRAAALGYTNVDWYAEGTDGWAAQNLPLEHRDPMPRPAQ